MGDQLCQVPGKGTLHLHSNRSMHKDIMLPPFWPTVHDIEILVFRT